jgi:flagellar M-ring protein FliF
MNENVKQLSAQLGGIWQHLGLNQRISIVMGAGVVLAGLLALAFWSSRADYALLG